MLLQQFSFVMQADASAGCCLQPMIHNYKLLKWTSSKAWNFFHAHGRKTQHSMQSRYLLLSLFSIHSAVLLGIQAQNRSSVDDSISPFTTPLWPQRSVQPLNFPMDHPVCMPVSSRTVELMCVRACRSLQQHNKLLALSNLLCVLCKS